MYHFGKLIPVALGLVYLVTRELLYWITRPLYLFQRLKNEKEFPLPIENEDIICRSASYLARKIRSGELKSEDVVSTYIKRMKEVNGYLNAIVEDRFKDALEEARAADRLVASQKKTVDQLKNETPFLGVPFTVKECCSMKGMSFCVGSVFRVGVKASEDGEAVRQLKYAGAIPIAVTNTPEWCFSFECDNFVTGKTLNPYDPKRTPGGSSGGEAAIVGSGASAFGVGSDFAGSIRIPALFTGIFGHKPTPGYVPVKGHFPYSEDKNFKECLTIGPLCRYAEDLVPLMKAMAGNKAVNLKLDDKVDISKLNVFYSYTTGYSPYAVPVDSEITQAITKTVGYLNKIHGVAVTKIVFTELAKSVEIYASTMNIMSDKPYLLNNPNDPKKSCNIFGEMFKALIGWSQYSAQALFLSLVEYLCHLISGQDGEIFLKQREALKKKFIEILGTDGVFIYPTYATLAGYHGEIYFKLPAAMYSMIFNVLEMPSTNVPLGLNSSGIPVGLQVAAAPHQDRLCFAVAEILERGFGGWVPPPSTSPRN